MLRSRAELIGGITGSLLAAALTLIGLLVFGWGAATKPEEADAAGPPIWLLLGGGCGVPISLFYGWLIGVWLARIVHRRLYVT